MKKIRVAALATLIFALIGFSVWQGSRVKQLEAEAALLREKLAHAAWAQQNYERLSRVKNNAQASDTGQFRELLRLRGQIGILRSQLAEATNGNSVQKLASERREPSSPPQAEQQQVAVFATSSIKDLEARLSELQQKVEVEKQSLDQSFAALNVPEDALRRYQADYFAYLDAQSKAEELRKFLADLRARIRQDKGTSE